MAKSRVLTRMAQSRAGSGEKEQGSTGAISLVQGKPVERKLAGAEVHNYQLMLMAGQYLRLFIDPQGISVVVTLRGPGGQPLAECHSRQSGPTPISLLGNTAGRYWLEVHSEEREVTDGRYELRIEEAREMVAQDQSRVAAERAFAEAEQLRMEWREEALRRAIKKYEDAHSHYQAASDRREEANALRGIGEVYYLLGNHEQALNRFQQALLLSQAVKDHRGEVEALNHLGTVYAAQGEYQQALGYYQQALTLSQGVDDRRGEALTLNNTGEIHYALSDEQQALGLFNRALPLWQAAGDRRGQAQTLRNIGYVHTDLSAFQKALDSFHQALPLWRAVRDLRGQAQTTNVIGVVYSGLGERQKALDCHRQAAELFRAMGDRDGEATTLNGTGSVYEDLGEKEKALHAYHRALQLCQALGDRLGQIVALGNVGRIYDSLGQKQKALSYYHQALSFSLALRDPRTESYNLAYIAGAYTSLGSARQPRYYRQALSAYYQALKLSRAVQDRRGEAAILNSLGYIYDLLGKQRQALDYYRQALLLSQATEDRGGEALTLYRIARATRDQGKLTEARARIEPALSIVESQRAKVASQELRTSYLASVHQYYELYLDLLMRLDKQHPSEELKAAALQASERARARSLLETLAEAQADVRQGIDPALLEREHSLRQLLNAKAERQTQLLSGKHTKEEATAIGEEIRALMTEHSEVRAQIRAKSPHYAALMQPQPLSLTEIQQQVLDDNTLLLEYALGEERSYLWAVTPTSITSHELPGRAEIEEVTRRVYRLLRARQSISPADRLYDARVARADAQYWTQAAALSRMLLGPVAGQLGKSRLLIVAEGGLQYIPFTALPVPDAPVQRGGRANQTRQAQTPIPLMVEHEIISLPSASALAVLRREIGQRPPAPRAVAVLADPVFAPDDSRILLASKKPAPAAEQPPMVAELRRALRDFGRRGDGLSLPRLLSSREEAKAIMAATPAGAGMVAIDFTASRAKAMSQELSQYRIVHFATHGLLNSEHPELSGVVLSLVDEQGRPQDGFLRLHDIYNLRLPAELVVLSACETGLGKEIKGEGLVGLVRGFMYAGAARVVASLWKVDDAATAELMGHFYRQMLKHGKPPAAALREAQVAIWRQQRWQAPYFWAAFVLQGEWK